MVSISRSEANRIAGGGPVPLTPSPLPPVPPTTNIFFFFVLLPALVFCSIRVDRVHSAVVGDVSHELPSSVFLSSVPSWICLSASAVLFVFFILVRMREEPVEVVVIRTAKKDSPQVEEVQRKASCHVLGGRKRVGAIFTLYSSTSESCCTPVQIYFVV